MPLFTPKNKNKKHGCSNDNKQKDQNSPGLPFSMPEEVSISINSDGSQYYHSRSKNTNDDNQSRIPNFVEDNDDDDVYDNYRGNRDAFLSEEFDHEDVIKVNPCSSKEHGVSDFGGHNDLFLQNFSNQFGISNEQLIGGACGNKNHNRCHEEKRPCDKPRERPCEKPCERPCEKPCERPCEKPCERPCEKPCEKKHDEKRRCSNPCEGRDKCNSDLSIFNACDLCPKPRCGDDEPMRAIISVNTLGTTLTIATGLNEIALGHSATIGPTGEFVNDIAATCSAYQRLSQATAFDPVCGCLYVVPTAVSGLPTTYASLQTFACLYIATSSSGTGLSLFINNTGPAAVTAAVFGTTTSLGFVSSNGRCCPGIGCKSVCPITFSTDSAGVLEPAGVVSVSPITLLGADVAALAVQTRFNGCVTKKFKIYSSSVFSSSFPSLTPSTRDGVFIGTAIVSITSVSPLSVFAYSVSGCRLIYPTGASFIEECTCEPNNNYVFGPLGAVV
jgi:hypothetical protein